MSAIIVALSPTKLPQPIQAGECGSGAPAPVATPLQGWYGLTAAHIHMGSAIVLIVAFGVLCFYYGWYDRANRMCRDADGEPGLPRWDWVRGIAAWISNRLGWRFHRWCGYAIVAGGVYLVVNIALANFEILDEPWSAQGFHPLWFAEFVAILAFGVSWFTKGLDDMFWRREPISKDAMKNIRASAAGATAAQ